MRRYDYRIDAIPTNAISLDSLGEPHIPVIMPDAAGFYRANAMVCLNSNGHNAGVTLEVNCDNLKPVAFQVEWGSEISPQMLLSYKPPQATDHGACAIALLLIPKITEFTAVEIASIGTTVDYYLGSKSSLDSDLIFNHAARLEASGILKENRNNTVKGRINEKLGRLIPDPEGDLPTFIVVVEFSKPYCQVVSV